MKRYTLILFAFIPLFISYLNAQIIKFYLTDGTFKKYSLNDIENFHFSKSSENSLMKIFHNKNLVDYIPTKSIDYINFGYDSLNNRVLNIKVFGIPKSIKISEIDSIIFANVEFEWNDKVIIIDSTNSLDITYLDSLNIVFKKISTIGSTLKNGDIIASKPTRIATNGFLRRVISVNSQEDKIAIKTENVKLTDVIKNGIISFKKRFTPSDTGKLFTKLIEDEVLANEGFTVIYEDLVVYDNDGNIDTKDDQIKINGTYSFNPELGFNLVIENGEVKQCLVQFGIVNTFELVAHSSLKQEVSIKKSLNELLNIPAWRLPPITMFVGPIPVVITSNVDLQIGLNVNIGATVEMNATCSASATCGIEYNNGNWKEISQRESNFSFNPPTLSFGGSLKFFIGPQLNVNFYGLQDAFNAYTNLLVFSELVVDLLNKPLWAIWGGIEANAGIESTWFKWNQEFPFVIKFSRILLQAKDLIFSVTPPEGKVGDTISIKGEGFGNVRGQKSVKFKFGKSLLPVDYYEATEYPKWSDEEIKVVIPNGLQPGNVKILVSVSGFLSNMADFRIIEPPSPYISNINPPYAKIGDVITIIGKYFGTTQSSNYVSFGELIASEYLYWSDTLIIVKVPQGAKSGPVFIVVKGKKSNEYYFTVLSISPTITSISPNVVNIGDIITISGSNFGSSQGTSYVSFNNINGTDYLYWNDNQIKVKVPTGLSSGKVRVSVTVSGVKSNEVEITINSKPKEITIYSSKDAYFEAVNGNANYNGVNLKLGYQENPINQYFVALYFAIPNNISSDQVAEAYLYLTKQSGSGSLYQVAGLYINSDWNESSINGNWANNNVNFNAFDTKSDITGDLKFPMTSAVKKWLDNPSSNYGIVLYPQAYLPRTVFTYYDRENDIGDQKPRLVITLK